MKSSSSKKSKQKAPPSPKSLANLKPFKQGVSGNAGGQKKIPEDIKAARAQNNDDVERIIHRCFAMTRSQLAQMMVSDQVPSLQLLIGGIVQTAVNKADHVRATFLLERAGCRLPPLSDLGNLPEDLSGMTLEDLMGLCAEAMEVLKTSAAPQREMINVTNSAQ